MRKLKNKKIAILSLAAVAVLAAGSWFFFIREDARPAGLNLDPPTEQEKQSGDKIKPALVEQEKARNTPPPTTNSGKVAVTPVITYAGHYRDDVEVGAYVGGIFEEGGKCTLTLSKDGREVRVEVNAVRGANSVDCPVMAAPASSLGAGKWQAVVTYTSAAAEGASSPREVEVK